MPFLLVGYTSNLPEDFAGEELILLAEGLEAYSGPEQVPQELLSYQITFLSGDPDLHSAIGTISETWRSRYGFPIALTLLEDRLECLRRSLRSTLNTMPSDHFSVRLPVVAFSSGATAARDLAAQHTRSALTRQHWQFWR